MTRAARLSLIILLLSALPSQSSAQDSAGTSPRRGCSAPEHRQFDFWVGDWDVTTPTGKLAVIRREDKFTLAPWRPALEPLRGRVVSGMVGPNRVMWSLDRGRALPGRS